STHRRRSLTCAAFACSGHETAMHFSIWFRSTSIRYRSLIAALLLSSPVAYADFAIPGFELVHTVPVGTDLQ
ncbi:Phospholipase D protein, partial [Pseudomonas coronafaciens pv. zizaniae]